MVNICDQRFIAISIAKRWTWMSTLRLCLPWFKVCNSHL